MSDLLEALRRSVSSIRDGKRRPRSQHGPDLSQATKDELAAMARDLDIPGRSAMTRDELARAVAQASDTAPADRRQQVS